jgi:CRISPR/Cas system-associated exonuclease Cas4 (RecB family)
MKNEEIKKLMEQTALKTVDNGHSEFSPSSSDRWMNCPASLLYNKLDSGEEKENPAAWYGTAIHNITAMMLNNHPDWKKYYGKLDLEGQKMAKGYVSFVKAIKGERLVEVKLSNKDLFGSVDALIYNKILKTLHIIDLKTGFIKVDAEKNFQLLTYAVLAADNMKKLFGTEEVKQIHLTIYQPRIKAGKVWIPTVKQVITHATKINRVLLDYSEGKVKFETGDHCKYCAGKLICPKLLKENGDDKAQFSQGVSLPIKDGKEFKQKMELLGSLKSKVKDLETNVMSFAKVATNELDIHTAGWILKSNNTKTKN